MLANSNLISVSLGHRQTGGPADQNIMCVCVCVSHNEILINYITRAFVELSDEDAVIALFLFLSLSHTHAGETIARSAIY